MRGLFAEFRQFILRGNVVDLAVGIVIGAAFTGVVQGLVKDIINPLVAAVFGEPAESNPVCPNCTSELAPPAREGAPVSA